MRAEVLAVGTELLLGQIIDTNSSWIGEQLALAGIDCLYQAKVGDNPARINEALRAALERADAVIVCGGLGPTQDDLTRDTIADVLGVKLVRDPVIEARIRAMFASRGREMPANNLRQADVPEGCHTIAQQPGTAPGLVCPVGAKIIYAVPGVPSEMREMVGGTVIPELAERAGLASVIRSRTLRTWGQSESGLAEMLDARMVELDASGQATLAFLASGMEGIKVRVTVKAADDTAALAVLDSEEAYLRGLLGDLVFGLDEQTMEHAVGEQLARLGWSLALAESLTGGMMATRFSVAAADRFRGALVSALAGLDDGGVSAEALTGEAAAAAVKFGAQVGLAVGFGGRIVGDGPPTSLVRIAMAFPEGGHSTEIRLPGDRERLRQMGTISAFDSLRRQLSAL